LVARLQREGHEVVPIVRGPGRPGIVMDTEAETIDVENFAGFTAVVHLAGHNVAAGRWTKRQKQLIRSSRIGPTRLLAEAAAASESKPALICASAVGFYGDRGDQTLKESAPPGEGFLAEVCQAWEAACDPLREAGGRVVNLRLGVVLSRKGGALAKMLTPFRLGLGGPVGSGRQYMPWVSLEDVVGAICHAIDQPSLSGPLNITAPEPVRQKDFAKTLGRALGRPAFMPMPAFVIRLLLGREMADQMLLSSTRALPEALLESGYTFEHSTLEEALDAALKD
ncbi:MAG: TIGR01777 family oxidoreductase, partial [Phycisphaeraceae bacterium]|nr:TIGR01777 family oxidoreductase [Phycisphaeraceae bacterium]